jgi:hypothetical protein
LQIKDFEVLNSKVSFNGMPLNLPQMQLSHKNELAVLQGSLVRRQLRIHDLNLPGPDVKLELKGKFNLLQKSQEIQISRVNIKGRFAFSEKMEESLPIVMIEQQKSSDGYFPLNITGRINKPKILIGEMEL